MHVLLIAPGHVIHTRRIIIALLGAGHRVSLLSGENSLTQSSEGYQFIPFPGIRGFHRLSPHITSRLSLPIRVRQIRKIWERLRPDIVNVHGVDMRAVYCAKAGLHPLVLTCWGADINDLFEKKLEDEGYQQRLATMLGASYYVNKDKSAAISKYKTRIAYALRQADLVTAVTPELLARCERLAEQKLATYLFRFGVDFNLFNSEYSKQGHTWRHQLGIPQNAKVLLSVRTLQPLFGHDHILEAFAHLIRDGQIPETVLVFHEKSSFQTELTGLRSKIKELGLESKVFWLPDNIREESLPVQYSMSDIVINYPVQDGFPVSLLEAAACKRPVVSSDLQAYKDVYDGAFFLTPPSDPSALADNIKKCLMEDEADLSRRIETAFSISREVGDQQKNFEGLFEKFHSLVDNSSRPGARSKQ